MIFNQPEGQLVTLQGHELDKVDDFTYLSSRITSSEKDIKVRIGKAWGALQKMNTIWKSNLKRELKISLFRTTVETILLYGATTWTLTKSLERKLDGVYTRMLRAALNISWKSHTTNKVLYGKLPPVSLKIKEQRLQFSEHCQRSKDEVVHDVNVTS